MAENEQPRGDDKVEQELALPEDYAQPEAVVTTEAQVGDEAVHPKMTHMRTAAMPPGAAEEASLEVDVDLPAALVSPTVADEAGNVASSQLGGVTGGASYGERPLSLLGSSLTNRPATREGKKPANAEPGAKSSPSRRPIVDRYAAEVREADRNRKIGYLPMQKQIQYIPAGRDIARDMRAELHDLTKSVGGAHLVSKVPSSKEYMLESPTVKTAAGKEACQVCGNPWQPDAIACRMCGKKQAAIGFEALLGTDRFQKRMQFLHENSRTGHFIEQYGVDGMYEGEFVTGMRHGKGKYEFKEEVYDGEWKWDHRHGMGELRCNDGSVIKGEWQQGKIHGFATVVDQKGTIVYEGEFKDGMRHGLGRQLFESGDMYDGGWQNGRLHDRGVYYFTNGDRLYGMWREGIYDGVGVFHYADGSISRREYRDGLLMSVQDYEHATQRFGKTITRGGMQKHTRDRDFPKDVFLLNAV